jgi:hypothetical protein
MITPLSPLATAHGIRLWLLQNASVLERQDQQ